MIKPEDIEIPEWLKGRYFEPTLSHILAALANNPIVPTDKEAKEIGEMWDASDRSGYYITFFCTEWQRRMFLRKRNPLDALLESAPRVARDAVLAAYELGKKEGK